MFISDAPLKNNLGGLELVNHFGKRRITHAFHDIDGTYSLIRKWEPVMSIVLNDVIEKGLPEGYDSEEKERKLIKETGQKVLPETDRFCIESAGLSALTQMEWAIRRSLQDGQINIPSFKCSEKMSELNNRIINEIWNGIEISCLHEKEPVEINDYISEHAPKLFRFYERVLKGACRNLNLEDARCKPSEWIVPGGKEFLERLHNKGVKNYFITGAVVEYHDGKYGGCMYEELEALKFSIGKGKIIENICGSEWNRKVPKATVMKEICIKENVSGANILVVGDGRSEILAGVEMGAVTISRLPKSAKKQRSIHRELGVNVIVPDYKVNGFLELFKNTSV